MKLPKALIGAILVGIMAQTTSCTKGELPMPDAEKGGKQVIKEPYNCPACGMG